MQKRLRALILEDSQSDALLLLRELRHAGYDVEHTRVESAEGMLEALDSGPWDVILSDYSMPQFSATTGLELLQQRGLDIPFIIVSGTMGEETAVAAMKAGAQDYFPKGRITRLAAAIEREVREAQEREQRRKAEEELRQAEERFARAFQSSPIGITITSQGHFLSANDSFRQMLGLTDGEIVGRTAEELAIWNDSEDQKLLEISLQGQPSVRDAEIVLVTLSKETRYVSVSTQRIDVSGEACVLAMWQDVTDRKRAEEALKKNTELIQLLQAVTTAANEATEINSAVQFAVDHVCRYAGWPLGHVYMRSRGGHQLVSSRIWHMADEARFSQFREVSERLQFDGSTGGLVYQVFESGTPRSIIAPVEDGAGYRRLAEAQAAGISAMFAFPVFVQSDVVAVIEFFATATEAPDQALLDTIPHIAAQIGHVVERVRANEEIRALYNATDYLFNAESLQGLAQQIVQGVVQEFEQVDCGLLLIDHESRQLNRVARAGHYQVMTRQPLSIDGPGLVPRAIREDRIVYAPDVAQEPDYMANVPSTQSEMVVPLKTRDGMIGVLDLQSAYRHYFNESDERVLGAFAERAAAALEITRLYEEINRYAAELEVRVEERTEELQRAKDRVEAILNNSSDAIILVDMDGAIQQTNPRFIEIFGYDYDELFRESLEQVVTLQAEDETLSEILNVVAANRAYRRVEAIARRKDGTTFHADAAFAAFARNHETEIVCSLRDISERKQLEQELRSAFERQKELAELKTRFISTVSHEYRTPLAVIQTTASLMLMHGHQLDEQKKQNYLRSILEHVQHLTGLMDDVLEINRAETIGIEFNPEPIDVVALCEKLVADSRHVNPDYQIDLHVTGEPVSLTGDAKLIRQIVSNLLSNAVKYSPGQGKVQVDLHHEAREIRLTVSDEGMGIPPDDLDDLFTLFHRAGNVGQIPGSGLGLAIVRQAVDAHGGTVSVESAVGQGTRFTVTLPL